MEHICAHFGSSIFRFFLFNVIIDVACVINVTSYSQLFQIQMKRWLWMRLKKSLQKSCSRRLSHVVTNGPESGPPDVEPTSLSDSAKYFVSPLGIGGYHRPCFLAASSASRSSQIVLPFQNSFGSSRFPQPWLREATTRNITIAEPKHRMAVKTTLYGLCFPFS